MISSPGIGSGLDVNSIVGQLMAAERQPLAALNRKEATYQIKLSAYGNLKGSLASFQSAARNLNDSAKFQRVTATSADTTLFSATAEKTAALGNYTLEVKQLAVSQKLASKGFTNTTDTVGTGTLQIQFGTYDSGANTFSLNADKPARSIAIDSSKQSLAGIRDAINEANAGVTASIVNDGSTNKLVVTSSDTGTVNSLRILVKDDDGNNTNDAGLSQLAYDPTAAAGSGKNLSESTAAADAKVVVDGVTLTKASNTIKDAIEGVTLNLTKVGAATKLTVERDTGIVRNSADAFVKAYNSAVKTLKDLTAYDPKTQQAGPLQGDASARTIASQLRGVLNSAVAAVGGKFATLSDIGIAFQKDGSIAVDAAKLQKAIDTSYNDIADVFAVVGRPSDSAVKYSAATADTKPGKFEVNISQMATQAKYTGGAIAGTDIVIDAASDNLALKIDGVQSATLSLTQGTYKVADLAKEIQTQINGDSALRNAGVTVKVDYDATNKKFLFTSSRYGAASKAEVTSVDTDTLTKTGIEVKAGTDGVDVAGSINGVSATGSGQYLAAATGNSSAGLKLQITGGGTGARGTVNFSRGYANQLEGLTGTLLSSAGPLSSRTEGINRSIESIGDQRDAFIRRLASTEKRYRAQFTALDSMLSNMNRTSSFLTQQLANLPSIQNNR
ncbi:MAG: flagellar filament capping protein FliD [Thiobacillus sp.]|nr:flagellar filament capping protein FliD [Thiobacillus sp.]